MKIIKQDYKRLREILDRGGYKKAKDYLKDKGFARYHEWGWIKEERMDKAISLGLVKYSEKHSDFLFTQKGAKTNIFEYLNGGTNTIILLDNKS